MKKIRLFIVLLLLFSCSRREFGKKIEIAKFTPVLQLKKYPENYRNQYIKIKGKVVETSSDNFWITVQDEHFIVMVELDETFREMKNILNKKVIIIGKLGENRTGYCVFARWLKIL